MLYRNGYHPTKPIPSEILPLYDLVLIRKGAPPPAQFHHTKWPLYYLDSCLKYHHEPANKENFAPFDQELKDKNQTEQHLKQAFDAVSILVK